MIKFEIAPYSFQSMLVSVIHSNSEDPIFTDEKRNRLRKGKVKGFNRLVA